MDSWRIRLDQINCFNYICGLTDLIISALVIFGKSLSGFLFYVYAFAFYSYVCENNDRVKTLEICLVLAGNIKLITCSCS